MRQPVKRPKLMSAITGVGRPPGTVGSYKSHVKYREDLLAKYPIHPLAHFLNILNAPENDRQVPPSRRDDAAKAAAPYLHPRLGSIELVETGGAKHSVDYSKLSDEELEKFEKLLAKCSTSTIKESKKDD